MAARPFLLLAYYLLQQCESLAYAPNFITKTIEDQTGKEAKGLLRAADAVTPILAESTSAKNSNVCTRFPPEPNGYLHLGHAKAVSFNFAVARMFDGVCHMRLDDTNPSKEDKEYVDSILEDVRWIQQGLFDGKDPWDGPVRKTSNYFDTIYESAVELIKSGDAYVDSLSADEMRDYRGSLTEPGKDSPYRNRSVGKNLELFEGMKAGKFDGGEHVLRAKIDMASPNMNMRDPTLYRIKHEFHQETGDKWCIYPMYDFSHPISDAIEGITHSLCTLEFEDHRPFYDWTIGKLLPTGLIRSQPQQMEFSRLNVQSTVLSKRKLIQLVNEKHVFGWDDPRMPTLSGMRRRGIPPTALRLFCERVGISKADSNIDLVVLEDCVREVMDSVCPRAFCVLKPIKLTISNWEGGTEVFSVDRHPKLATLGEREIPFSGQVYIERDDFFDVDGPEGQATSGQPPKGFKRLLPGGQVRLRYAYVVECHEIIRDRDSLEPVELKCTYYSDTKSGAKTEETKGAQGIIHWVDVGNAVKCTVNQYDRLFSTEEPGKESGDFLKDLNQFSLETWKDAVVEPSVLSDASETIANCEKDVSFYPSSLAYQFERTGYFALDKAAVGADTLVFNRVVTLRDTWGVKKMDEQRSRGNGNQLIHNGESREKSNEPIDDVLRVALRAATVLSAEPHPRANGLLVCKVDCGDVSVDGSPGEPRTVVAGLAGKISIDKMVGSKVVAVTNLKPAKLVGIESFAMLLVATDGGHGDDEKIELLTVPDSVPNGELISFEGKGVNDPDPMMKSKGALKVFDRVKAGFQASVDGEGAFVERGETYRMMTSHGPVRTTTLKNVAIQ
jgi:glutaminyl-tRNA synthetase